MTIAVRSILDYVNERGPDAAKDLTSAFSCSRNADVERFVRRNAVEFALQGITMTYAVFDADQGSLAGMFAIANRILHVPRSNVSKSLGKRLEKFSDPQGNGVEYALAAPLIAQIGKNDASDVAISGHELLDCTLGVTQAANRLIGGRIAYLECEDVPALMAFYEREGFRRVGRRVSASGTAYHVYIRFARAPRAA